MRASSRVDTRRDCADAAPRPRRLAATFCDIRLTGPPADRRLIEADHRLIEADRRLIEVLVTRKQTSMEPVRVA